MHNKISEILNQLYNGYHLEKYDLIFIKPILQNLLNEVNKRLNVEV